MELNPCFIQWGKSCSSKKEEIQKPTASTSIINTAHKMQAVYHVIEILLLQNKWQKLAKDDNNEEEEEAIVSWSLTHGYLAMIWRKLAKDDNNEEEETIVSWSLKNGDLAMICFLIRHFYEERWKKRWCIRLLLIYGVQNLDRWTLYYRHKFWMAHLCSEPQSLNFSSHWIHIQGCDEEKP